MGPRFCVTATASACPEPGMIAKAIWRRRHPNRTPGGLRRLGLSSLQISPASRAQPSGPVGRHAQAGIAEQHELHPLKEDAGRIPVIIRLQRRELLLVEVVADGASPTSP